MSAVNRHRERFPGTMSNDDLKKQEGDFATNCGNPMEGDSKSIIQNLELLKQAVLIDTNKNLDVVMTTTFQKLLALEQIIKNITRA